MEHLKNTMVSAWYYLDTLLASQCIINMPPFFSQIQAPFLSSQIPVSQQVWPCLLNKGSACWRKCNRYCNTLQILFHLNSCKLLAGRSFAVLTCTGGALAVVGCADLVPHACVHQLHTVQEAGILTAPKLQLVSRAQPHRPVGRQALVVQPGARCRGQVGDKVAAAIILLDNRMALADLHSTARLFGAATCSRPCAFSKVMKPCLAQGARRVCALGDSMLMSASGARPTVSPAAQISRACSGKAMRRPYRWRAPFCAASIASLCASALACDRMCFSAVEVAERTQVGHTALQTVC